MPKGVKLADFGPEFSQLLLRVDKALSSGKDDFTIQFATVDLAHALRFRIYAYFKALRSCVDRPDLAAMCSGVSIRIAASALVFYRRGEDKESAALRDALGLEKGFSDGPSSDDVLIPASTLDSNLSQLRELRARAPKKSP